MRHFVALIAALLGSLIVMPATAGPVDINTADAPTLARELTGVGMVTARAIVAYRQAHGPFASGDDLRKVKGIGPSILDRNRAHLRVTADEPQDNTDKSP